MAEKKAEKATKAPAKKTTARPAAKTTAAKAKTTATKPAAKGAAPKRAPAKRAVARPITRAVPAPPVEVERAERREAVAAPKPKAELRPLPTAPSGEAPVIAADGSVSGTVALPLALVAAKQRPGVLFQALTAAAANAHLGTASTRNRARVRGGGAKPWRQKGTGRARQGSTRSPQWRHGGVVFGPNGRRYGQRMPAKMRHEAFAEAFASRAGEGRVLVYDELAFGDRPRTKAVVSWLRSIGDTGRVLLVTAQSDEAVSRAAANAPQVGVRTVGSLRTDDVLRHDTLVVKRDALEALASRASVGGGI